MYTTSYETLHLHLHGSINWKILKLAYLQGITILYHQLTKKEMIIGFFLLKLGSVNASCFTFSFSY
jgi:hypothetical protein